jgi:WD40 repeat protein
MFIHSASPVLKDAVNALAVSPDGLLVVTGSDDKTVKLWDLTADMNEQSGWQGTASSMRALAGTLLLPLLPPKKNEQQIGKEKERKEKRGVEGGGGV